MDAPVASRRVALEILMACLDKGQPLDDALARHPGFVDLDPRDRAFVRLLLVRKVLQNLWARSISNTRPRSKLIVVVYGSAGVGM